MPPNFQQAYEAGKRAAVLARGAANETERVNLERLQVLSALTGVQGLTEEDVAGVLRRDPSAIARLATRRGGMLALKTMQDFLPPRQTPEEMFPASGAAALFRGAGLEPTGEMMAASSGLAPGQAGPPAPPALPSQIPTSLIQQAIATAGALKGRETSAEAMRYGADVGATGRYYTYAGDVEELRRQRERDAQQAAEEFNKQSETLAQQVGKESLEILTNLQYPNERATSIAAKLTAIARAEMARMGPGAPFETARQLSAQLITRYGLAAELGGNALKRIERDIDNDLAVYEARGIPVPTFQPEPTQALPPPPAVERYLGMPVEPGGEKTVKPILQRAETDARSQLKALIRERRTWETSRVERDMVALAKLLGMSQEQVKALVEETRKEWEEGMRRQQERKAGALVPSRGLGGAR